MLATINATDLANRRIGGLSGGEQQRLRIGQALIGNPKLLLCDEPLISLDLHQQRAVSTLIDASRRTGDRAVLMITHDINPVLDMVDTVVYLAAGQALTGTVDQVLTSAALSELYQTPVDVIRARGRILVVGLPDTALEGHEAPPENPPEGLR
jgi:zinc/manganese transport system ATP-binding protein